MADVQDKVQDAPEQEVAVQADGVGPVVNLTAVEQMVAEANKPDALKTEPDEPKESLLKQTTFWLVWAGQSISVFGDAIYDIALLFWVATLPGGAAQNATALAGLALIGSIPRLTLGPLMSGLVDRLSRKWIMFTADLLQGVTITAISLLLFAGQLQLWHVYLAAFINVLANILHEPSFEASIANLVPKSLLTRANGLVQSSFSATNILGPLLGGTLIAFIGLPLVVQLNAFSFWIAAATMFFATIPQQKAVSEKLASFGDHWRRTLGDAALGFRFIRNNPTLFYLLAMFTSSNFWSGPSAVLTPLLVLGALGGDATTLGLVNSAGAAGFMIGAAIIGAGWLKFSKHYMGVSVGIAIAGLGNLVSGLAGGLRSTPLMLGAVFVDSAAIPIANTNSTSIWQLKTPDEMRGRVFSARRTIAQFTFPIGVALAAPAAAIFGVVPIFIFCGTMGLLTGIAGFFIKPLRTLED